MAKLLWLFNKHLLLNICNKRIEYYLYKKRQTLSVFIAAFLDESTIRKKATYTLYNIFDATADVVYQKTNQSIKNIH